MKINSTLYDALSDESIIDSRSASLGVPDHNHGSTRLMVFMLLLQEGPISAVEIAQRLQLSPVGVRRHLDALITSGMATISETLEQGEPGKQRKKEKGRPAKYYELTPQGRKHHGQSYARLAWEAIMELREIAGIPAVKCLAKKHVETLLSTAMTSVMDVNKELSDKLSLAQDIAAALTNSGYATTAHYLEDGIEICQHHCPVADVIGEFPEFCTAEEDIFIQLFDQPVQRVTSIAHGNNVCITRIPLNVENTSLACLPITTEPINNAPAIRLTPASNSVEVG